MIVILCEVNNLFVIAVRRVFGLLSVRFVAPDTERVLYANMIRVYCRLENEETNMHASGVAKFLDTFNSVLELSLRI